MPEPQGSGDAGASATRSGSGAAGVGGGGHGENGGGAQGETAAAQGATAQAHDDGNTVIVVPRGGDRPRKGRGANATANTMLAAPPHTDGHTTAAAAGGDRNTTVADTMAARPGGNTMMAPRNPRHAVAYLRCSTATNADGDTFERQRAAVAGYARRCKLQLVATFQDVISGATDLEGRQGLSELIEFLRASEVGLVIVESATRLARDALVHALIVRRLAALGVGVVTADGQDLVATDSPTARFVSTVLAALAELDRALTVARLKAARDRVRARRGRCEGPPPFGSKPEEIEVLELAKRLRRKRRGAARMSFAKVADELNRRGYRTRRGKCWTAGGVHRVLGR